MREKLFFKQLREYVGLERRTRRDYREGVERAVSERAVAAVREGKFADEQTAYQHYARIAAREYRGYEPDPLDGVIDNS